MDAQNLKELLSDQKWRLNNLYWIIDKDGERIKFKLNWAQAELLDEIWYLNIILKARQLGFTTFIQIYTLDVCLFYENTQCGLIADTMANAQSIFRSKIKYPYDNLPDSIKQRVSVEIENQTTLQLSNNSIIRVGTSLRSGTNNYLHVSEYGKICAKFPEKAREIATGALNTIHAGQFGFIESTAEGQEGRFYDMVQNAKGKMEAGSKLTQLDYKFHFFPWWREPDYEIDAEGVNITGIYQTYFQDLSEKLDHKTGQPIGILNARKQAWYVKKAEVQEEDMKREFPSTPEEAFEAAIEGAYYARQISKIRMEKRITRVPYEPELDVETWWDLGMDDSTAIWFVQKYAREIRFIDYYENSGEGLAHYAKVLREKDYRYSRHIGPHDSAVKELGTGVSRQETAEKMGLKPWIIAPRLEIMDGIEACRNLFSRAYFDADKTAEGFKALTNYRKEWNEDKGVWMNKPFHNWASHGADAMRTGAVVGDAPEDSGKLKIPDFGAV